jgi:hypothetical protein
MPLSVDRKLDTMTDTYDSTQDTHDHISKVQEQMAEMRNRLRLRALRHDASKLAEPEKALYDILTPRLKGLTYGSDEYKANLAELKPALEHHYANNSHHPEHYPEGIAGMDLLDLVEMLCDWRAAGMRHSDGDMTRSLEINRDRFKIDPQLYAILCNTARRIGWTK